jgi:DNA-binding FadR family transcriptional regulator
LSALAASRGGEACVQELTDAISAMAASLGNTEVFLDADLEFHTALAEGAGNRLLLQFMVGLRSLLREFISEVLGVAGSNEAALEHHRAVLEAVKQGDSSEARRAMHVHLDYMGERLLHRLSESMDGEVTRPEGEETPPLAERIAQD